MRLAYLVSKYPAENHAYILREITGLRARGFEIEVIAISPDDRHPAELNAIELSERETTFVVKTRGALGTLSDNLAVFARHPASYVRGLRIAVRLASSDLRRIGYNLAYLAQAVVAGRRMTQRGLRRLHAHYTSTVALLLGEVFRFEVSATIHGSAEFINPELNRIRDKVKAFDRVVAISKYGRSQLMFNSDPQHWSKIHVVPLGVHLPCSGAARERPEGHLRIVSVGQLQPAKGLHILLDAVALLSARNYKVSVTLVGDGPYKDGLVRHAQSLGIAATVTFTGRLNPDEVQSVYARSDVFVLASFAEGVPVVLMEAMSNALPSVATRITGIPELLRDGVDGLLVTPSDSGELAEAIASLIDDPERATTMADSGRTRVGERYNLDTNLDLLASVLRD